MKTGCAKLRIERFVTGELDVGERAEVCRHLAECSECAVLVQRFETERTEFLREHPFSSFTCAHAPLVALPWYRALPGVLKIPALRPVYGVLLVAVVSLPLIMANLPRHPDILYKGSIPLTCILRRGNDIRSASPSERFRSGDQVQFSFPLTKRSFVTMFSIDSHGTVSFYQPDSLAATCSVEAGPGSAVSYPSAITLDNSSGTELVVVLFSAGELARDKVTSWVKNEFDRCHDPAKLPEQLERVHGAIAAGIATSLLRKE